jgi:hypothetical protein
MSFDSSGNIVIYDPLTNDTVTTSLVGVEGNVACNADQGTSGCSLNTLGSDSTTGDFTAGFDLPDELEDTQSIARRRNLHSKKFKGKQNRRRLQDGEEDSTVSESNDVVLNPVTCIIAGSAVLFSGITEDSYPMYNQNNFLNTNFDFDFGAFLNLGTKLAEGQEINSFVFTFEDAGVYVFYNSNNTAK